MEEIVARLNGIMKITSCRWWSCWGRST